MTAFSIKMVAITTMLIDHIGIAFFPNQVILRIIGRISFPLFAWLVANGAHHTKSIEKYLGRLFLLGVVSIVPYNMFLSSVGVPKESFNQNIGFTLYAGLLCIYGMKKSHSRLLQALFVILVALTSEFLHFSYGAYGVLFVVICYVLLENLKQMKTSLWILVLLFHYILPLIYIRNIPGYSLNYTNLLSPFGLFSLLAIKRYNGERGRNDKYLFYLFYPVHLFVIYAIKNLFLS